MSMIDIDGALTQAYIDMGLGLETAYEGEEFKPEKDGSDWAKVTHMPGVTSVNSLGVNGTDLHEGYTQIDFRTRTGQGRAGLIGYAQAVMDEFVAGKSYTRNSQRVRIGSQDGPTVERSPIREVDAWLIISVIIHWEAETIRPSI